MKQNIVLLLTLLCTQFVLAQKVDIDNYWIKISTAQLPDNKVLPENRTYTLKLKGEPDYTGDDIYSKIKLYGWTNIEENSAFDFEAVIKSFTKGSPKSSSRKEETKDKNGKVTSSRTLYKVTSSNYGQGTLYINGEKNSYSEYNYKAQQEKKKQEKEQKEKEKAAKKGKKEIKETKEEKEKKEIDANPFLKNVDTTVKEVEDEKEQASSSSKKQVYALSISKDYTTETSEYSTSAAASKQYNDNQYSTFNNNASEYKSHLVSMINHNLNKLYGYTPINENVKFKTLDSEKHPEFNLFDSATKAMKLIFGKMRYNQDIETISSDLKPIIEYFITTSDRLEKSDDKQEKRLRAACYYNLAQIYFYLDQHDKVIEIGNKIIASDYDKKDGQRFIDKAEAVMKELAFHNMTSRHITPLSETENSDEVGDTIEASDEDK